MPRQVGHQSTSTDKAQSDELPTGPEGVWALDSPEATIDWLSQLIDEFEFDVIGLARRGNKPPYPLPTEPGTLAHLIETSAASYLEQALEPDPCGVKFWRGGQRGYPDIELSGGSLGDQFVALDIKVARRKAIPKKETTEPRTQSRITLLTGNTYFLDPVKKYPSVRRAYGEYAFNLDWVILFSIDQTAEFPEVKEMEHVVAETWQLASKFRSSTTRNYIGAVDAIADLKAARGAFASKVAFENYWRSFDWSKNATPEEIEAEAESEVDD